MMLLSRKLAVTFLCVFLLGGLAGWLLSVSFSDLRFYNFLNRTSDPASLEARLNQRLVHDYQITADEQARISPLTKEMAQNLYALRHKFATDVLAIIDDSHQKIAQQLTPEQRVAYQKANEDRRKRTINMLMPDAAPAGATVH